MVHLVAVYRLTGCPLGLGKITLHDYDPAEALDSAEAIEVFLADALETGDASYVAEAVEVAKRAMQRISQDASECL